MGKQPAVRALVLLVALVCLTGCGDKDDGGDGLIVPETRLPFPDTADKLMQNFQTTYETMNFTELTRMMDPAYFTVLKESTCSTFPDVGTTLDLEEETRIHERMFSMRDVTDPQGNLVAGIQAIAFQLFQRQGSWGQSPANEPIPNAEYALYDVVLVFDRGQAESALIVQGAIKFFVAHRDSVVGGVPKSYYRMIGQMDLTWDQKNDRPSGKGTENNAWGSVKALFR